jgi:hypothetical protein
MKSSFNAKKTYVDIPPNKKVLCRSIENDTFASKIVINDKHGGKDILQRCDRQSNR